jgi:hypothetical protein
MAILGAWVI